MIVATAGHVDHGKTSLIKALTGIETDTLAEEQARGLSINLGYAHVTRSDGSLLSFIDVPGHHRFMNTMIAGIGGGVATAALAIAKWRGCRIAVSSRDERKLERARETAAGELEQAEQRLVDLAALEEEARTTEDPAALDASAVERGLLDPQQQADPRKRKAPAKRKAYRSFQGCHGHEIWVGRTARDNDELTVRLAPGQRPLAAHRRRARQPRAAAPREGQRGRGAGDSAAPPPARRRPRS